MSPTLSDLLKNVDLKDPLLTPKKASEMLSVKVQTLAAWRHRGHRLPWVRLGGRAIRYRLSDLVRFIEENRHGVIQTGRVCDHRQ